MQPNETRSTSRETDLQTAITERLKGIDSGKYRSNTEHVLSEFAQWLLENRDIDSFDKLTPTDCRRYAQYLRDRTRDENQDLSASSANTYYAYVRAFLGWCVRDGRINTNPAAQNQATEELPADSDRPDRQFWKERDRNALLAYVDKRVDKSFEDERCLTHLKTTGATVFSGAILTLRMARSKFLKGTRVSTRSAP